MDRDGRVARARSAVKPTLLIFKLILNLIRGRIYSERKPGSRGTNRASERASEQTERGVRRGNKIIRTSSLDKTSISDLRDLRRREAPPDRDYPEATTGKK